MPRPTHPYIWTAQGWLYLAVVIDLYSRKVKGWALGERIDSALVVAALTMAIKAVGSSRGAYFIQIGALSTLQEPLRTLSKNTE